MTAESDMQKLKVELRHCYGIPKLDYTFDFSKKRQYVVYAPNGVMKSSLAKCFKDFSEGQNSSDRIYKDRQTDRRFLDENGTEIAPENVFVVEPYNERYKSNRMSTLLVNDELRQRYDAVRKEIDEKSETLEKMLASASGLKRGASEKLASDIVADPKEIMTALGRLADEVATNPYENLSDIKYGSVFNDKTETLLADPEMQKNIADYMAAYDSLTSNSSFFKRGIFNHNNAADVAKSLKQNGFFKASHSVYVNNKDVREEIKTVEDLEKYIQAEKDSILSNPTLSSAFEKIDKMLVKNVDTKEFRSYLAENDKLLPELGKVDRLKQRLWASYLSAHQSAYQDLRDTYERGRGEIEKIVAAANNESTRWKAVIDEFNDRFAVPFVVTIENQTDVILKLEAPSVRFRFQGKGSEEVAVDEADLMKVLSNGELRALYLLNIIFEVIAREEAGLETLFVMDDIADSFDYKNKYAIVEYISDISEKPLFKQIILTHNYDFFRTLSGRLDLARDNILHADKSDAEVTFRQETYQKNPFVTWKDKIDKVDCDDIIIASVPFLRNMAEYTGRQATVDALTAFLHVKPGSDQLKLADLEDPINEIMAPNPPITLPNNGRVFFDLLLERAKLACSVAPQGLELEAKILLAIAIRVKAEQYMIKEINDPAAVESIKSNQTFKLMKMFKDKGLGGKKEQRVLKQVHLMTPENIHLNSFMFEPILDMSSEHLKRLFDDVCALGQP